MSLSGQFQVCLFIFFFYEKLLSVKKHSQAKFNQHNKNKRTKNNKVNIFYVRKKTSKRVKVTCFAFWCFFCAQNLFEKKKINRLEIVLITSLYYTTPVKLFKVLPINEKNI